VLSFVTRSSAVSIHSGNLTLQLIVFGQPFIKGFGSQFSARTYCGQTAGWIKMTLGIDVGLGPGHIVLDRDPAPLPKKGAEPPQFLVHVYCGQTAVASRYHFVRR